MVILWYYNGIIIGRRVEENAFFIIVVFFSCIYLSFFISLHLQINSNQIILSHGQGNALLPELWNASD